MPISAQVEMRSEAGPGAEKTLGTFLPMMQYLLNSLAIKSKQSDGHCTVHGSVEKYTDIKIRDR